MIDIETVLGSGVRLAVPLAFAAIGECASERSGAVNLSVEGMMLAGALGAAAGASASGSPEVGLLAGALAGLVVGLLQANLTARLRANQFVVGIALTIWCGGLAAFCYEAFTMNVGQVAIWRVPLLSSVPVVGPALFRQRWPAYLLVVVFAAVSWLLHRSRIGLEMRAAGENPYSARVAGVDVAHRRRQAIYLSAVLSGFGGAYLVVGDVGVFTPGMIAGRGFIVLAAVVFGGWTLRGALVGSFFFGLADALRLALPAVGYSLNPQLLLAAPYVAALLAMAFFAGRNRRPAALVGAPEVDLR